MKKERVRGYGNAKKSVTFKDNMIVLGLCVVCAAVIAITFYVSKLNRADDEKSPVSKGDSYGVHDEDYDEVIARTSEDKTEVSTPVQEDDKTEVSTYVQEAASEDVSVANEDEIYSTEPVVSTGAGMMTFDAPLKGNLMKGQSATELVYSKTLEDWRIHNGIDIAAKIGTTVCAVSDGVVEEAKKDILYGHMIIIDHGNNIKSIYCNLTGTAMVQKGKNVDKGEPIGMVGDSAIAETSDEAHLHFEMTADGNYVNPMTYFSIQ